MLKKLFLSSLLCGLCFGANAIEFNTDVLDELRFYVLANNQILDDDAAGEWYLRQFDSDKYFKVYNDEFERPDAYKQAKETLEKLKEQHKNLDTNKTYVMYSGGEFKEYNFEKEEFPVEFITEKSFYIFDNDRAKGKIWHCYGGSRLVFDNVDTNKHTLKMAKDEAKKFVKDRKEIYNRYINIDIEFSISKVDLGDNTEEITVKEAQTGCVSANITGHIKKLTLIDQKSNNKVLSTIEYE